MSQSGSWIVGGGPGAVVETLTGNTGGAVPPSGGNINVVGSGNITVTGNPGTSTLTISEASSTAITFDGDTGSAVPTGLGVITIEAGQASLNCGSSVLFSASGNTVELFITDSANNILLGKQAGNLTLTGSSNVGIGLMAFDFLTSGISNVGIGTEVLLALGSGSFNCAIGQAALQGIQAGNYNTAIGYHAGAGYTTGTESSNISIGYETIGTASESNTLRIGVATGSSNGQLNKAFICGIDGRNVGSVATVVTEASDQLGTAVLTPGSGISITPGANTITIANTAVSSISITGDSGGALTGNAFTFTGGATGLTFAGAGTTETLGGTLAVTHGGSGAATFTTHGVLLGEGTSAFGVTAVGTTGQVLTGVTGSDPVWASPAASSISITGDSGGALTGNAFTFTGGTTGLTFSGSGSTETLGGKLIVANGGTNSSSFNINGVVISGATTTSALTSLTLTNGQVVIGSTGAAPTAATLTAGANISITNAANSITIAANTGASTLNYTGVNHAASPYTVLSTDNYISADVTGGVVSILLPNSTTTGRIFTVKDKVGLAASSNITVTTVGGAVNIDGATSFVMNTAYESIQLIFNGSTYEVY